MTTIDLRTLPPELLSWAEKLAIRPEEQRLEILGSMVDEALEALATDWAFWGRPEQQLPLGDWRIWLVMAGRGFGKTRTGSEAVREKARRGTFWHVALVGATAADVRDLMVEGPSGLVTISPDGERPVYEPSKRRLTWPNGARGTAYSDADPEALRGFEGDLAWIDEFGKYRNAKETWDNLAFAMREGRNPQRIVTTTPRMLGVLRDLIKRAIGDTEAGRGPDPRVVVTRGSTFRNAGNLASAFLEEVAEQYEGTRLGEQELHGVLLEDVEGALWQHAMIEAARLGRGDWARNEYGLVVPAHVALREVAVGVDPPGGKTECGIVVGGKTAARPATMYVLDDRSVKGTPLEWGRASIKAYVDFGADVMVVETNFGGDMVRSNIAGIEPWTDPETGRNYPGGDTVYIAEAHASRGKEVRAQPIVGFYQQGRVKHLGRFPMLEAEQTTWIPGEGMPSPNRLDALVWIGHYLLVGNTLGQAQSSGAQIAAARMPNAAQ